MHEIHSPDMERVKNRLVEIIKLCEKVLPEGPPRQDDSDAIWRFSQARTVAAFGLFTLRLGRANPFQVLALAERAYADAFSQAVQPDWERGIGIVEDARKGHEAVHGSDAEKQERWRRLVEAYREARKGGRAKKAAKLQVSETFGVSVRQIERAHQYLNEPII